MTDVVDNSMYGMHTIHMIFNNFIHIIVGMNLEKLEKEKLGDCR